MESPESKIINGETVYKIIEQVRRETLLSFKLASHAVYVVIDQLTTYTPTSVKSVINDILKELEEPLEVPEIVLDGTEDMERLLHLSKNLHSIKNDTEQRSWELFDDQAAIVECLNEFESRLGDADISIVQRFLRVIDFDIVNCLAEYYQMEKRWSIKIIILRITDMLCSLSRTCVEILLASVLPLELTRDVQINNLNNERLIACIRVLVKLFAIGDPLPVIYFGSIDKNFILFLLNLIETPSDDQDHEENVMQLLYFVLVYNLQFKTSGQELRNEVITALEEAENPKIFSETLLLLFNRGKDPVKILDHQPHPPNSLLKMMTDIFSNEKASNIFYKNDVKVLIDIIVRQLTDDSPTKQENSQWLKLIKQILAKTDKEIYVDRLDEIEFCVNRMSSLLDTNAEMKQLVDEIQNYFSECR